VTSTGQTAPAAHELRFDATLRGRTFDVTTTWGLFHPRGVDAGTALLLDRLEVAADATCLDLGCGWGPIGLTLAHLAPAGRVHLVDKDFVAVDYARANLERNAIANAEVLLSNGLDQIPPDRRFDVVATNLPAKIGNELTTLFIADSWARLRPGGRLYLVTLSGMRKFVQRVIQEQCGTYEKVKQGRIHTVHRAVRASD